VPEPKEGSVLTGDGRRADLFDFRHYPVRALCRLCGESIRAESFFQPFEHVDGEQLAQLIPFPGRDSRGRLSPALAYFPRSPPGARTRRIPSSFGRSFLASSLL
jgi:hypothetical protein